MLTPQPQSGSLIPCVPLFSTLTSLFSPALYAVNLTCLPFPTPLHSSFVLHLGSVYPEVALAFPSVKHPFVFLNSYLSSVRLTHCRATVLLQGWSVALSEDGITPETCSIASAEGSWHCLPSQPLTLTLDNAPPPSECPLE